jgi:hypothetical protein
MGMEAISWCERRRPFLRFLAASARCLQEIMEDLDEEREQDLGKIEVRDAVMDYSWSNLSLRVCWKNDARIFGDHAYLCLLSLPRIESPFLSRFLLVLLTQVVPRQSYVYPELHLQISPTKNDEMYVTCRRCKEKYSQASTHWIT